MLWQIICIFVYFCVYLWINVLRPYNLSRSLKSRAHTEYVGKNLIIMNLTNLIKIFYCFNAERRLWSVHWCIYVSAYDKVTKTKKKKINLPCFRSLIWCFCLFDVLWKSTATGCSVLRRVMPLIYVVWMYVRMYVLRSGTKYIMCKWWMNECLDVETFFSLSLANKEFNCVIPPPTPTKC